MQPPVSTKPANHPFFPAQAGNTLIDALLAMVIVAMIGLASTYASAKASLAQQQSLSQEQAGIQLRALLNPGPGSGNDLLTECQGGNSKISKMIYLNNRTLTVTVGCNKKNSQLQVNKNKGKGLVDLDLSDKKSQWDVSLSVQSDELFGKGGAMKISPSSK